MAQAQVRVHVDGQRPGWVVLELLGHFTDEASPPVDEYLSEVIGAGPVSIVIDATNLEAIDPGPCRSWVAAARSGKRLHSDVFLTRPPAALGRLLGSLAGAESIRVIDVASRG